MFFISKLVSIVLLNETYAYITQNTEIILLPASNPINAKKIPLTLKVFGQLIQLKLRRNDRIVSPTFGIWKYNAKSVTEKLLELNVSSHCQYYHEDHISSAVINFCHEYGLNGHIFLENDTMESRPFWNDFRPMCLIDDFRDQAKTENIDDDDTQNTLTIEFAVFFDDTAYHMYMPILNNDEAKLHKMILAYVNQIQALFHQKSFGVPADISLVHLEIMKTQPSVLFTLLSAKLVILTSL